MIESPHRLRVLVANELDERLNRITTLVEELGHEIVARSLEIKDVGPLSRETGAEVALVGLGLDSEHALDLITSIVHEAACPVIALLDTEDPSYVDEAAKRGVFAYVVIDGGDELQAAVDITLRRFAEFSNLQGAFGRRAIIEQAKGILMARNRVNADQAFQLLKAHSQHTGRKLVEVAAAVVDVHDLVLGGARSEPSDDTRPAAEASLGETDHEPQT